MTLSQETSSCQRCGFAKARFLTIKNEKTLRFCLRCVEKMRSSENEADHDSVSA
jgi:hypothetical protein